MRHENILIIKLIQI